MSIDRTAYDALVDEPPGGPGTTGTPWNKSAIGGVLLDPIDAEIARIDADVAAVASDLTTEAARIDSDVADVVADLAALAATVPALPVTVPNGGTGAATLGSHGVLLGHGTSAVTSATPGTSGYVLTSNGASADPTWQAVAAGGLVDVGICEGRFTLTSGTPVTTADVTGATSGYWTPLIGNRIALYDGSAWQLLTFAELTLAFGTMTAGIGYDVFAYINSGVVALEKVAWSSATARFASGPYATVHPLQDGVKVKSTDGTAVDATRRYLASFYALTTTTTEDSFAKRLLSNYYNRRPRPLRVTESTDSWSYTTATMRQTNNAAANQVAIFVGVADSILSLEAKSLWSNATAVYVQIGIGEGSTSTVHASCIGGTAGNGAGHGGLYFPVTSLLRIFPAVGYQFYASLEASAAAGTTSWYGDTTFVQAGKFHTGMQGWIWG